MRSRKGLRAVKRRIISPDGVQGACARYRAPLVSGPEMPRPRYSYGASEICGLIRSAVVYSLLSALMYALAEAAMMSGSDPMPLTIRRRGPVGP